MTAGVQHIALAIDNELLGVAEQAMRCSIP